MALSPMDRQDLGRWHAAKDAEADAHFDDEDVPDDYDEDAEYELGIDRLLDGDDDGKV
jgi:hypothetical protein